MSHSHLFVTPRLTLIVEVRASLPTDIKNNNLYFFLIFFWMLTNCLIEQNMDINNHLKVPMFKNSISYR